MRRIMPGQALQRQILWPLAVTLGGCGPMVYTPWSTNAPAENLTAVHLSTLATLEPQGPAQTMTFAIIGDTQRNPEAFQDAADRINAMPDVDFTILAGDITDMGLQQEFTWMVDVIRRFRKPILTVVGNHDGISKGKKLYLKTFGPFDYTFTFRGLTFAMWNNNPLEWEINTDWLEQVVKDHPRVIVVAHQPPHGASLNAVQLQQWAAIRKMPSMHASLHGHLHKFNFYVESDSGKPIYTVERVANGNFGLIRVSPTDIRFFNCTPECHDAVNP